MGEICAVYCSGMVLGSEAGSAIASVLLGDVNPSGKLPFTFPVCLEDVGAHKLGEYPGVKRENENIWDAKYNEGILWVTVGSIRKILSLCLPLDMD